MRVVNFVGPEQLLDNFPEIKRGHLQWTRSGMVRFPYTPNPNTQTINPNPQTPTPKPQTLNTKPQTPNPKPQAPHAKRQTLNPKP